MTSPTDDARNQPREPTMPWIRIVFYAMVAIWLATLIWSLTTGTLLAALAPAMVIVVPMPLLSLLALNRPELLSVPNIHWWTATARRSRRFERLLREDLMLIAALTLALLVSIQVTITREAAGQGEVLSSSISILVTALYLAGIAAITLRMFRGRYAEQELEL